MKNFLTKLTKLIYSKTFWINFLMAFLVIVPRMAELPQFTLSAEMTSFVLFIVNIILRWITNEPLEEKGKKDA